MLSANVSSDGVYGGKKTVLSSTKPLVLEAAWYCILLTLRKGTQNNIKHLRHCYILLSE